MQHWEGLRQRKLCNGEAWRQLSGNVATIDDTVAVLTLDEAVVAPFYGAFQLEIVHDWWCFASVKRKRA